MTLQDRAAEYIRQNPIPVGRDRAYYLKAAQELGCAESTARVALWRAKNSQLVDAAAPRESALAEDLRKLLSSKTPSTLESLADRMDVAPARIRSAVDLLRIQGFNVEILDGGFTLGRQLAQPELPSVIDVSKFKGKTLKWGFTADNHLGSKYERLDVLNALFDIWEEQGVTDVYQGGNMIDGEARFNRFDIHTVGMEAQVEYFVEHWPKRQGITTHFVAGDDHEGWYVQREGVDIGRLIERVAKEKGREDLHYLGYMEANIVFEGGAAPQVLRVIHAGGGAPYAVSYAPQKIVESLQGGEKPTIMLIGHHHKFDITYPRNVLTIMPGCTEDQTPFMRKKRIEAHIGGVTVEVDLGKDGLFHNITHRWHPFYDRDFYKKAWKYHDLYRPAA